MANMKLALLCLVSLFATVSATVYFEEKFSDDWEKNWLKSTWKQNDGTAGDFTLTAGKFYGDAEANKGVQTGPDARFYAMTAEITPFDNKDKDLVVQFSVKHEQGLDCGGGYIKLSPSTVDAEGFNGDSAYNIMFGPDICGTTKRVHVIFNYKGENHLIKKTIACETDTLTHVYTLVVKSDNSYKVLIDNEVKSSGSLEDEWDFLPPKTIVDPEDKKPEDWDERSQIDDPEDVKPEGHDDIPEQIADPEASKPEDWDDEDDGEWEPRMIENPEYQGEWSAKKIENPEYKGIWKPQQIDNPAYAADENIYHFADNKYVGFELWQVKSGSIFDNILVTDDEQYALEFAASTWGETKDGEKEMFDSAEEVKRAEADEERKAAEEAAKALEDEEPEEDADEADEYEDEYGEKEPEKDEL